MGKTSIAVAALLLAAAPRPAAACRCRRRSPEAYVKRADLVFVARAGKEARQGKATRQALTVLHALKGEPGRVFQLDRPAGARSTCDRTFNKGEVALVFVTNGSVSTCDGNFGLVEVQLKQMDRYLKAGRPAPGAPSAATIGKGLAVALDGYLHDRPKVPVHFTPLDGKTTRIGKTELRFTKGRRKHAVELTAALKSGHLLFLSGRYHREGYRFRVLLLEGNGGRLETLARWGTEH